MTNLKQHQRPAIHNAMWPGLVGKGPDSEPFIELETMLDLTANAEVERIRDAIHEIANSGLTLSKLAVAASLLGDLVKD